MKSQKSSSKATRPNILGMTAPGFARILEGLGFRPFRAGQVFEWVYRKKVLSFGDMSNISLKLRKELEENFTLSIPEIIRREKSSDGTVKYLIEMGDGEKVESALIPHGRRLTLCLSTQAGCRFGCLFCASGASGFGRNLEAYEITGQYLAVSGSCGRRITNIVFMGVGEPLDNFEALMTAVDVLSDPAGPALGKRKISVSTCGIAPGIRELTRINPGIGLSVSLHSADPEKRKVLVPVTRKYPLKELKEALREFTGKCRYPVSLEYILISGFNVLPEDGAKLADFCKGIRAKVNLIPCNPSSVKKFTPPDEKELAGFLSELDRRGIFYSMRRPRGRDISAACGQLRYRAGS